MVLVQLQFLWLQMMNLIWLCVVSSGRFFQWLCVILVEFGVLMLIMCDMCGFIVLIFSVLEVFSEIFMFVLYSFCSSIRQCFCVSGLLLVMQMWCMFWVSILVMILLIFYQVLLWKVQVVLQYWQCSGQLVRCMNMVGQLVVLVLFCSEVKILVIFRCGSGDCMMLLGVVMVLDGVMVVMVESFLWDGQLIYGVGNESS